MAAAVVPRPAMSCRRRFALLAIFILQKRRKWADAAAALNYMRPTESYELAPAGIQSAGAGARRPPVAQRLARSAHTRRTYEADGDAHDLVPGWGISRRGRCSDEGHICPSRQGVGDDGERRPHHRGYGA